jgi:acetyltransferase-like isoleucine patch superfamily enzyme
MSFDPTPRQKLQVRLAHDWGPRLASRMRQRWVKLRNPMADISFGPGCRLGPGFSLHAPWGGTFRCGPGCEFRRGFRVELAGPESTVEVGDRTVATYDVLIQCASAVRIGADCGLGQATLIVDGNHRYRDLSRPPLRGDYDLRPINIGDGAVAWSKNTIIADIGERAILGSGAVAVKPIPPYTVAVGAPARVIDYFGPPGQEPEGWPPDG